MKKTEDNFAFIDSQNLNLGVQALGCKLDWRAFRRHLDEVYSVTTAYSFIGYAAGNEGLYRFLQEAGYVLVFKPVLYDRFKYHKTAKRLRFYLRRAIGHFSVSPGSGLSWQ